MSVGNARILHHQLLHYFRKRVNFDDAGIAAGVIMGTLPAGALIVEAGCRVNTAFDAGTTNVLRIGTTATGAEILAEAVSLSDATGFKANSTTPGALSFAVDTDIYASYTQTGTAATEGQADLFVSYIPNNDG